MYKIIQETQIIDIKIESCVECPNFYADLKNKTFTCLKSDKILPYIYKFPIPPDCPLP